MADDAWSIKNEAVGRADTLDKFSQNGNLNPQRELLHETIVQAVTERRIITDPTQSYDAQLEDVMDKIKNSPDYAELERSGSFSRDQVSQLFDKAGLERLPEVPTADQVTTMVTGGPATGKTGIVRAAAQSMPDIIDNSARINPDDYKALLASPQEYGAAYADMAHREGGQVTEKILGRLEEKIQSGRAPHVLMDVVAPNDRRMAFANQSPSLVVLTGTAPPEVTVERAHNRGLEEGRQVPTNIVLEGNAKISETLPRVLEHPNVELAIYNTDVPRGERPTLIAQYDSDTSRLIVKDPDGFADFMERRNLNRDANAPDKLWPEGAKSPEKAAEGISAYTDKGITIELQGADGKPAIVISPSGVESFQDIPSKRGSEFFEDVTESLDSKRVPDMTMGHEPSPSTHGGQVATPDIPRAAAPSLMAEFGRRAGVVAGIGIGVYTGAAMLSEGASASEAALGTAEAAIPGVSAAVALEEGRYGESVMRGIEEIPLGIIATEILRPIARGLGADIDQSMGQMIIDRVTSRATESPEQQKFMQVFDGLPSTATPDMPPEVASLVEQKSMLLQAEAKFESTNSSDMMARNSAQRTLEGAENSYTEQYDELVSSGGIETVDTWMKDNPIPDANAPAAAPAEVALASSPVQQTRQPVAATP